MPSQVARSDFLMQVQTSVGSERIQGHSQMAERIRAYDWAQTPLGPVASWPDTITVQVNTALCTRYPMLSRR
jgi:hypothetical protein